MIDSEDYIEGVKKGILMGYCEGCSHAYPMEDLNSKNIHFNTIELCEECELGLLPEEGEE
tara:strand:- start:203 stop:382 length:180 start_codon:yes stop_codon:yes gene_type:complete